MSNPIENRPLVVGFVSLIIGISAPHVVWNLLGIIPLLWMWRSLKAWTIAAAFFLAGFVLSPAVVPILASSTYLPGEIRVLSQPTKTPGDLRCDGAIGDYRVRLVLPSGTNIHLGDVLRGGALIAPVPEAQEANYQVEGLQGVARLKNPSIVRNGPIIFVYCDQIREEFDRFLLENCTPEESSWIDALWFRSGSLPAEDRADLATSGAYSLVAASGLQVYLLFGLTTWLLGGGLKLDRKWQIAAAFFLLCSYWVATGMHGNTFRACLTCLALSSAYLVRREPDILSATAFAGITYLVFFPRSLYSLGFQLSMAIPIALGLFNTWGARKTLANRITTGLRMVFVVFLVGQPLIAEHTGRIGFGGLFSGLILGSVAPIVLGSALVAFAASFVIPMIAKGVLSLLVLPLTSFFRFVVETISSFVPAVQLPTFGTGWLVLYYGLWLVVWREREVKA